MVGNEFIVLGFRFLSDLYGSPLSSDFHWLSNMLCIFDLDSNGPDWLFPFMYNISLQHSGNGLFQLVKTGKEVHD